MGARAIMNIIAFILSFLFALVSGFIGVMSMLTGYIGYFHYTGQNRLAFWGGGLLIISGLVTVILSSRGL